MMLADLADTEIQPKGGYFANMPASQLPAGASGDCQDVVFVPSGVKTRPGMSIVAGALGPTTVNGVYLTTYICAKLGNLGLANINMAIGSDGSFWESVEGGVWTQLPTSAPFSAAFAAMEGVTAFGRKYFAPGDGSNGTDMPLQFDGTFLDRVSQEGPGRAPNTGDSTIPGSITAGPHGLAICFVTRQGYITAPSPISDWTAAGGFQAQANNIPIGPPNVVARIIVMTLSGGGDFFYVPSMIINDNTTTLVNFSVPDTTLAAGTDATALFNQIVLGECQGVASYSSRLFWWGERNKINNALNLMFDGGFDQSTGVPLGWSPTGSPSPGGAPEQTDVVWGGAWSLTGDGVSAFQGSITQQLATDQFGVPIIQTGQPYVLRARIKYDPTQPTPTAGTINVTLSTFPLPISGGTGITINCASLTNKYVEYVSSPVTILPFGFHATPYIHVYTGGILNNGARILVDVIEICPANQPIVDPSLYRGSAAFTPESYDSVTSLLQVNEGSNIQARSAAILRENFYLALDRGLYVTQDDGVNEPSGWSINEVSKEVSCTSVHGVTIGDEWFIVVGYDGVRIFGGSAPIKISQELISYTNETTTQPFTWQSINPNATETIWAALDMQARRLYIGVPTGNSTQPNKILYMDFTALGGWEQIATEPQVHDSAFTGRKLARDDVRKWAPWNVVSAFGAMILLTNGTQQLWIGNAANNGEVFSFSESAFGDVSAAINSYWTTGPAPDANQIEGLEARMQRSASRYYFGYLTLEVAGAGQASISAHNVAGTQLMSISNAALVLANPQVRDLEFGTDFSTERAFYKVGTNAFGAWFLLKMIKPWVAPSAVLPFRGGN